MENATTAFVCFEYFSRALEDKRLGGMESSEVGRASGIFVKVDTKHSVGVQEKLSCFLKEPRRFQRHRSMPSRLISCMSGERS